MSEHPKSTSLRITVARGLAALKVMIDNVSSRAARNEEKLEKYHEKLNGLETRLEVLKERIDNVKDDVTGTHDLKAELARHTGKQEAVREIKDDEKDGEKTKIEKAKANTPIYVAIITAGAAFLTGIINMILHFLEQGGGGSGP